MKVKIKDMQNKNWDRVISKKYVSQEINIDSLEGVISLTLFEKVKEKLDVYNPHGKLTILSDNYKWLQLALKNQHFWLTSMYDEKDNLIEIYFDITIENNFDDIKNPYCYDLFNDIVIHDGSVFILDEDELEQAFNENVITKEQYDLAKDETKKLYDYVLKNKEEIVNYCFENFKKLEKKI